MRGMLSFIKITMGEYCDEFVFTEGDLVLQIMDEKKCPRPIFNVQQVLKDIYILTTTESNFIVYNREQNQITQRIPNPSGSINYNCLQKLSTFSGKYPYLLYKDSRSIGYINCVTNTCEKLFDCAYKRCGNNYSMIHQEGA